MFELLSQSAEEHRRRRISLAGSLAIQIVVIAVAVRITMMVRHNPIVAAILHQEVVELNLHPKPPQPAVARIVKPKPIPPPPVHRLAEITPVAPLPQPVVKVEPKVSFAPPAPHVEERVTVPMVVQLVVPPPAVKLDTFSPTPSSAPPVKAATATPNIASAGFGSPAAANGHQRGVVTAAGFGDPEGNSTSTHPRGSIASSGFGTAEGGQPAARRGSIAAAGFDQTPATAAPVAHATAEPTTPVAILFKPDPDYTPEARALHLEGDVLLRVVFQADGHLRILGVVQGLGHGLDDSALRAAQQIRFTPARRGPQPIDTDAILHVTFQLAND